MELLEKRFLELSSRADERYYTTYSDFLNIEEESILSSMHLPTKYKLLGGYDMAERCLAAFGNDLDDCTPPISIIKIEPLQAKFSDDLSHRDFLGTLMGLGIKREVLGDIVVDGNIAYLFCLDSISQYIVENLDRVKHTSVKCKILDELPNVVNKEPEFKQFIVASERIDVVIAAVHNFSRSQTKEFFTSRRIYVNSKLCENYSYNLKNQDVVTVRGKGKFIFSKVLGTTKKNRLIVEIGIYN